MAIGALWKARACVGVLLALASGSPALAAGASFEGVTGRPIIEAIDKGDASRVQALLKSGADPNDFGGMGFAPLHAAASKGDLRIAEILLDAGAGVELRAKWLQEWTPLMYAVEWGQLDMVKLLVRRGANVNARTHHGYSVLHKATGARDNSLAMMRWLIERGADVNAAADNKTTVLQSAVQDRNSEGVALLLKAGANPEARTYFGGTVILDAVGFRDVDTVRVLLKHGVSLAVADTIDASGPLHSAAYQGNLEIARLLLAAGADPTARDKKGRLAEDVAVDRDNDEVASMLKRARLAREGKAAPSASR